MTKNNETILIPEHIKDGWYVASLSKELKNKPLSVEFFGQPVVLFRGKDGQPIALEDRCPHKNLPLSIGKVKDGNIECAYHGWRFNQVGKCTMIPCHGPKESIKKMKLRVPKYDVIEQDGWIWMSLENINANKKDAPRKLEQLKKYGWFDITYKTIASPDLVLENGMDSPHTCFVHKGLFRSEPDQFVNVEIKTSLDSVIAETFGENQKESKKKDVRMITSQNDIRHIDSYHYPCSLQIDYWFGKSHVITHLHVTPNSDEKTTVFIRMGFYFKYFNWAYYPVIWLLTHKVVRQDRKILENQQKTINRMGGRKFHHSLADLSAVMVSKLYASGPEKTGKETKDHNISFKL